MWMLLISSLVALLLGLLTLKSLVIGFNQRTPARIVSYLFASLLLFLAAQLSVYYVLLQIQPVQEIDARPQTPTVMMACKDIDLVGLMDIDAFSVEASKLVGLMDIGYANAFLGTVEHPYENQECWQRRFPHSWFNGCCRLDRTAAVHHTTLLDTKRHSKPEVLPIPETTQTDFPDCVDMGYALGRSGAKLYVQPCWLEGRKKLFFPYVEGAVSFDKYDWYPQTVIDSAGNLEKGPK